MHSLFVKRYTGKRRQRKHHRQAQAAQAQASRYTFAQATSYTGKHLHKQRKQGNQLHRQPVTQATGYEGNQLHRQPVMKATSYTGNQLHTTTTQATSYTGNASKATSTQATRYTVAQASTGTCKYRHRQHRQRKHRQPVTQTAPGIQTPHSQTTLKSLIGTLQHIFGVDVGVI
jgi:hypothetical protein